MITIPENVRHYLENEKSVPLVEIKGTKWYTASATKFIPVEGKGTKVCIVYGYRMPVEGRSEQELKNLMNQLPSDGINAKLRTSKNEHTGIPAGTPFLQVLDEDSILSLEEIFLKQGIELPMDRYKEYGILCQRKLSSSWPKYRLKNYV